MGGYAAGAIISPAVPASSDYQPGTWVTSTTSVINMVGISIPVVRSELVGQVGTPAQPAEYGWTWQVNWNGSEHDGPSPLL